MSDTQDNNSKRKPVVTYRQINKAFNSNHEAVMTKAQEETEKVTEDPVERAMILASLGNALSALEAEAAGNEDAGVMISPMHREASLLQSFLAQQSEAEDKLEPLRAGGEEAKFDEQDIFRWLGTFIYSRLIKGKPHKWLNASAEPEPFPVDSGTARLALLGDWGTGLYGAPDCAQSIESSEKDYHLLFHLGDVYYSGDEHEVRDRFLHHWSANARAVSRALNSNHEMYTGGKSYFRMTLQEFGQQASYFAMQNDHWLLVGLDSAYSCPDWRYSKAELHKSQLPWLNNLIANAGDRKVILFTHHDPFSWFGTQEGKMNLQLGTLLGNKKIFAWYWGHEHRCILYDRHSAWGLYGRCVGHGGFPYFRKDLNGASIEIRGAQETAWHRMNAHGFAPRGLLLDGPNQYLVGEEERYGPHGYMTLEFTDAHLNEIVHAPDETILYERQLV